MYTILSAIFIYRTLTKREWADKSDRTLRGKQHKLQGRETSKKKKKKTQKAGQKYSHSEVQNRHTARYKQTLDSYKAQ